jgi:hypothetical protein
LIRRLLREPLVHFLLLGALLFAAYGWLNQGGFGARDEILVSKQQVEGLVMQFERVWQRPPTADEKQALVDGWVRDEVFYREALAMGLEQDDPVVRRRMSQKVQFIVDSGTDAAPTDAELQRWLDEHADQYRREPSYAMQQVYFDPARHGDGTANTLEAARSALEAGENIAGDSTMLPAEIVGGASEVARSFGDEFERNLRQLPVGSWQGPVRSPFGLHLVRIRERDEGRPALLSEVRTDVARDLSNARAKAAGDAYYERLRAKYVVRIEDGSSASPPG